jgi:hypothetical protein
MSVLSLSRFEDRDFVKGGAGSVGIRPQVISVSCLLILSLCATTTTYSVGKQKKEEAHEKKAQYINNVTNRDCFCGVRVRVYVRCDL